MRSDRRWRSRYDCGDDPALVTRSGVGFRLRDLFPERHGFTVLVGSGRPLSADISCCVMPTRRHPLIFRNISQSRRSACPRAVGAADARHDGASAIHDLIEAELAPGPIANDQASIEADIRAAPRLFHPSGTCRMGTDPRRR